MARRRDRVLALILVLAFIVPTIGVSVALAWQVIQEGRQDEAPVDTTTTSNDTASTPDNTKKEGALEGTQLQDFNPVNAVDKVQVVDLKVGTGEEVKAGDTITFDYTGALAANGKIFQSSLDTGKPITYSLNDLIKGWQEGIPGMKVGGKRRLLIPAAQGYGSAEQPGIPANSDLVFDITVHEKP
jgi:FKBP-type peptidyl-prolyl cis-trans isomerase